MGKALPASLRLPISRVDPATGAASSVGNTGYAITGLAQDPTTGILYAVSNKNSPIAPLTLLTLNPANGAATVVGPLGPVENRIADITFNSQGQLYGWDESGDNLASINKVTGAVTVIPSALGTYGSGSAFDLNDNYWLFGEGEGGGGPGNEGGFFTVNLLTGETTKHGVLTPLDANESSVSAASFDCSRTTVYATINNFGEPPANLVTIDLATGIVTNKGLTVTAADGLEWFCPLAFEFTSPGVTVAGGNQSLSIPVVRGPRIKGAASVAFSTVNGSAHAGRDFVAAAGTLSFPNNGAGLTIPLTVTPDHSAGANRTFTVQLSSPSAGGTVGPPFTVTIKAGKPKPAKIKGPKKTAAERVTFKLRSNQLPARFRCKLDRSKFKGCGKNSKKGKKFETPKLKPGKHKLVVQVINGAGLKSKPARKTFTVLP
jgi:Calx-beta domain